jgi:hypothetical protein
MAASHPNPKQFTQFGDDRANIEKRHFSHGDRPAGRGRCLQCPRRARPSRRRTNFWHDGWPHLPNGHSVLGEEFRRSHLGPQRLGGAGAGYQTIIDESRPTRFGRAVRPGGVRLNRVGPIIASRRSTTLGRLTGWESHRPLPAGASLASRVPTWPKPS